MKQAGTLLLAVKPQDIDALLAEIAPAIESRHVVVSVAAGVTTAHIEERLPDGIAVVRCMPNTPALVDQAMTAVAGGAHAGDEHLAVAESLLASVGRVVRVPEHQLDAVTALSGSGPAYFFFLVEAMIDAGILLGLPRALAAELIVQTAVGAATMLRDSGEHPVQLREAVTSPGGTTIAAIRELEIHGVRAALLAAIEAAAIRSRELGAGVIRTNTRQIRASGLELRWGTAIALAPRVPLVSRTARACPVRRWGSRRPDTCRRCR